MVRAITGGLHYRSNGSFAALGDPCLEKAGTGIIPPAFFLFAGFCSHCRSALQQRLIPRCIREIIPDCAPKPMILYRVIGNILRYQGAKK